MASTWLENGNPFLENQWQEKDKEEIDEMTLKELEIAILRIKTRDSPPWTMKVSGGHRICLFLESGAVKTIFQKKGRSTYGSEEREVFRRSFPSCEWRSNPEPRRGKGVRKWQKSQSHSAPVTEMIDSGDLVIMHKTG